MRILNFEDDVYKANDIKKVLNDRCGVTDVTQVDNVEEGLELLIQEKKAGNPFDLIITDTHYPMRKGEEGDFDAGEKLLGILKERGIDTKVIICSSLNIKIREAYGCIWYSRISDWEMELLELMNQLKK